MRGTVAPVNGFRRPKREPCRRNHLERLITELGRHRGVDPARMRRWVCTTVLAGTLEEARDERWAPRFVLDGGSAVEARLRTRAPAHKDVEIAFRGHPDRALERLDETLRSGYAPFGFRLARSTTPRHLGEQSVDAKMTFHDWPWATLHLELSHQETESGETELVDAVSIEELGLHGPERVACRPLRYQIASKLHSATDPVATAADQRDRDLIDLLLLLDLEPDLSEVRTACEEVFAARGTHGWPPAAPPEPAGADAYATPAARDSLYQLLTSP